MFMFEYKCMHQFSKYKCMHVNARGYSTYKHHTVQYITSVNLKTTALLQIISGKKINVKDKNDCVRNLLK